jgi:hypothetical protein
MIFTVFILEVFVGTLQEKLEKAKVVSKSLKFITDFADSKIRGIMVNAAFKNPSISIKELRQLIPNKKDKPRLDFIYDHKLRVWAEKQLAELKDKDPKTYEQCVKILEDNATLLCGWHKATEPDLSKLGLFDVINKIIKEIIDGKNSDKYYVSRNIVKEFPDGFTIQRITTMSDVHVEGKFMQNCLRDYDEYEMRSIKIGSSEIYSLRDPENNPHVSIEFCGKSIGQVKGKQNDDPLPKYMPYIVKWLSEKTGKALVSHIMAVNGDSESKSFKTSALTPEYGFIEDDDPTKDTIIIDRKKFKIKLHNSGGDCMSITLSHTIHQYSLFMNLNRNSQMVVYRMRYNRIRKGSRKTGYLSSYDLFIPKTSIDDTIQFVKDDLVYTIYSRNVYCGSGKYKRERFVKHYLDYQLCEYSMTNVPPRLSKAQREEYENIVNMAKEYEKKAKEMNKLIKNLITTSPVQ